MSTIDQAGLSLIEAGRGSQSAIVLWKKCNGGR